jgi:biotin carboxyl carrier protein
MNYTIKVDGKVYDVKILDLHSTPIKVIVDGTEIEVWPEDKSITREIPAAPAQTAGSAPLSPSNVPPVSTSASVSNVAQPASQAAGSSKAVKAPLPGVIVAIKVKAGDSVSPGQELCTIEAMKMKNIIRATRAGVIATIAVNIGETVQHQTVLMEYAG